MEQQSNVAAAPMSGERSWWIRFTPAGTAVVETVELPGHLVFAPKRRFGLGAPRWVLVKARGHEGLEDEALGKLNRRSPDCRPVDESERLHLGPYLAMLRDSAGGVPDPEGGPVEGFDPETVNLARKRGLTRHTGGWQAPWISITPMGSAMLAAIEASDPLARPQVRPELVRPAA